jgi:hypothetical protein
MNHWFVYCDQQARMCSASAVSSVIPASCKGHSGIFWHSDIRKLLTIIRIVWRHTLNHLTYSMEQSPSWEANRIVASQEISRILGNPKAHYRIHKCPPLATILSQLDPVHTSTSTFWRSILILSFHLRLDLPSHIFPSGFTAKYLYTPLLSPICATCPAHLILLDFITGNLNLNCYS